ncbi:MAG: aminotransferase class V-fold PLP-dependent enzyme, partial [Acidimicrobiales bacterium]
GIHLVANGLGLVAGDEVIVASNDFPSDVLPWLRLQSQGVKVQQLQPRAQVLSADEISVAFTARTRAVCLTWVHSFSGH